MTQKQKLLNRLANTASDKSWTFAEAESVMLENGFTFVRAKGSHHYYRHTETGGAVIIPRHGSKVKAVYIKLIREKLLP